jgi:putative ABC transport system permease protein
MTERKLRTALTIIGIVIGPATIVSIVGATQGYSNASTARFQSLGATTIFVSPVGRGFSITTSEVSQIQNLAEVSLVLPYRQMSGQITQGGQTLNVQILSLDLSQVERIFPSLNLQQGSTPGSSDLTGAVLGNSVAYPNIKGATNATVNGVITISNLRSAVFAFGPGGEATSPASAQRSFVVRGIYNAFGQGFGINPDQSIFIPLSEGEQISHSQTYGGLVVIASGTGTVNQVISEIETSFGQNVRITSVTSLLSTIQSITQGTQTLLEAVGGTSILVAFFGIMTTMLTSVLERSTEIGVLKAIGASSRGVMLAFISEASVTGILGGVIGAAAGSLLSFVVISFLSGTFRIGGLGGGAVGTFRGAAGAAGFPGAASASTSATLSISPAISPEIILLAILIATAVGTIGGILPAWRASRLTPVEALHRS